jgi:hypothetical protein
MALPIPREAPMTNAVLFVSFHHLAFGIRGPLRRLQLHHWIFTFLLTSFAGKTSATGSAGPNAQE